MKCVVPENIHTLTIQGISLRTLTPPWIFHFFKELMTPPPPPLWIFHKYDIHPPAPPEMSIFEKNECSKSKAVMILFISDRLLHIRRKLKLLKPTRYDNFL